MTLIGKMNLLLIKNILGRFFKHPVVINCLLFGATFLFCIMLLETVLRIFDLESDHFYEPDINFGSRLIAGRRGVWRAENQVIPITINRFGYRGWDYPKEKSANVFRVAILGDSYIEALQVKEEAMVGRVLENVLNEKGNAVRHEVLSFGVSGYGTAQEYLILLNEVKNFQPDMVILAFTSGNDVRNNSYVLEGSRKRPYFTLKGDALEHQFPDIRRSSVRKLHYFFLRRLQAYHFVATRVDRILTSYGKSSQENDIPVDYFIYSCDYDRNWLEAWGATKIIIQKIQEYTERMGAKFILVNLTSYIQEHGEKGLLEAEHRYPAMGGKCWDLQKPNKILESFSRDNNILYLDLLPSFIQDYLKNKQEMHLLQDGHWNEMGHHRGGELIAEFLRSKNLVPDK